MNYSFARFAAAVMFDPRSVVRLQLHSSPVADVSRLDQMCIDARRRVAAQIALSHRVHSDIIAAEFRRARMRLNLE